MKPIVYFDLDDTLCQFSKAFEALKSPENPYPHNKRGFYSIVEPVKEAITIYKALELYGFTCKVLTAPSPLNPETYTGKAKWVLEHLGSDALEPLIICGDKSLLAGDYLIDDRATGNGQESFKGRLIVVTPEFDWCQCFSGLLRDNNLMDLSML